jgi:hypothetical protein
MKTPQFPKRRILQMIKSNIRPVFWQGTRGEQNLFASIQIISLRRVKHISVRHSCHRSYKITMLQRVT